MLKKFLSHTAIYGLAPVIPKIASFLILPIITSYLTKEDYGVIGVVEALIGAISIFSNLGLRMILVNSFYKRPETYLGEWKQIYGFLSLWSIPYTVLVASLLFFFIPDYAKSNLWIIILINTVPVVVMGQTNMVCTTLFQLRQKPMEIAVRSIIAGLMTVGLNLYFIAYIRTGFMGWFYTNLIVSTLLNISYWIPLNIKHRIKADYRFSKSYIMDMLRITIPMVPHYYSQYMLNMSDRLIMRFVGINTGDIGRYNFSYSFGNYFNQFSVATGTAMGPLMNESYKAKREIDARNLVFLVQILFFIGTFFICLWLKEVFQLIVNNSDLKSMYYLAIPIIMAYNYRPMYMGASNKLMYFEKSKALLKVTFTAGVVNVILNLVMVPFYGYEIAAFTTYLSFIYIGFSGYYFKDFKAINSVRFYPTYWLLANILITLIVYLIRDIDLISKFILSTLLIISFFTLILRFKNKIATKFR